MKVVQQLIAYFEERQKINPKQLQELVLRGFWGLHEPHELRSLCDQIGQSFYFHVTGEVDGPLWGTEVYTSDSYLGKACVHAGVLKPGETGIVRVTVVPPPSSYASSTRNGVTSSSYGVWDGAYRVELLRK